MFIYFKQRSNLSLQWVLGDEIYAGLLFLSWPWCSILSPHVEHCLWDIAKVRGADALQVLIHALDDRVAEEAASMLVRVYIKSYCDFGRCASSWTSCDFSSRRNCHVSCGGRTPV